MFFFSFRAVILLKTGDNKNDFIFFRYEQIQDDTYIPLYYLLHMVDFHQHPHIVDIHTNIFLDASSC